MVDPVSSNQKAHAMITEEGRGCQTKSSQAEARTRWLQGRSQTNPTFHDRDRIQHHLGRAVASWPGQGRLGFLRQGQDPFRVSHHTRQPRRTSWKTNVVNSTAKNARPGRAYIHLIKKEDAIILDEAVRAATWEDAKGSFTNSCLVGPPILEHSIYKKVPLNKKRGDSRQGTIDQDPEFMAFLEELANPPGPNANGDADDADVDQKVTTTPLVEFLKEKKAAKSKEAANKKREAKNKAAAAKEEESSKKRSKDGKEAKGDKSDKTTKEPVKILSKKAATAAAAASTGDNGKKGTTKNAPEATTTSTTEDAPKSRRAGIAAAAKILQREQGLSPGTAHRKARQEASKPEATAAKSSGSGKAKAGAGGTASTEAEATDANKSRPSTPTGKQQNTRKRGGKGAEKKAAAETPAPVPTILKPPTILKKKPEEAPKPAGDAAAPATPAATPAPANAKPAAQANAKSGAKSGSGKKQATIIQDGTRGFVRHVNSSQGITDATLREALSAFGTVTAIDVDKRKAFAYVDFSDAEALTKAIAASPITVAQGTVSVMERKEKKPTPAPANSGAAGGDKKDDKDKEKEKPAGRGRRGRGGGGGGGGKASAAAASAAPASDGNAAAPAPTPAPADGSG